MPYIPLEDRDQYQNSINNIVSLIPKDIQKRPGHMNYVISLLIDKVYGYNVRYSDYNEIVGLLECAKMELYRRKTAPYEDKAIEKNGDLICLSYLMQEQEPLNTDNDLICPKC